MVPCLSCHNWFFEDGQEPLYEGICDICIKQPAPVKDNRKVFQLPDLTKEKA